MIIKIIKGDLLDATEKYITQQNNCVTVRSHGLSKTIADKYKYADIYNQRRQLGKRNCAIKEDIEEPSTFKICYSNDDRHNVICMFCQYAPGKPHCYNYGSEYDDSYANRELWFEQCLLKLEKYFMDKYNNFDNHVAIPYKIGCGLAGGSWKKYEEMLENSNIKFVVYEKV